MLPRNVHFHLYPGGFKRCQMFIRTCVERPEIADNTRKAHISCWVMHVMVMHVTFSTVFSPSSKTYSGWKYPCARLRTRVRGVYQHFFQNPFPELRNLTLDLPTISASEIFHFLKLPNIRNLKVDGVRETRDPAIMDHADPVIRASSVDQMNIWRTPVNPRDMVSILSFSPRLTSLHCIVPGRFQELLMPFGGHAMTARD